MTADRNVKGDFMAWARLSAKLWRRSVADRMRILTEAGVVGDWHAADQHWLEVMVQDIEAGQLERANTYAQLCAQALAQLDPDVATSPLPEHLRSPSRPMGWPPGAPHPDPQDRARAALQTAELAAVHVAPAHQTAELAALGERERAATLALDSDATAALPPLEERYDEPRTERPPPPAPASPDDSGATQVSITARREDD